MSKIDRQFVADQAFIDIEERILPGIASMLESIVAAGREKPSPGRAQAYASTLHGLALQVESITRQVESALPRHQFRDDRASAA